MTVDLTLDDIDQNISHVWRTSIQKNILGYDTKRSALFTWPRINLDSEIKLLTDEAKRFLRTHLNRSINELWNVPIINDKTTITSTANSGQKILTLGSTDYRHFQVGRQVLIKSSTDWETYELGTIDTIDSSTQITLEDNLVSTWGIGSKVYPVIECRVDQEQTITQKYKTYSSITIMFKEAFEEARDFSYTLPSIDSSVFPTYNSLPVFVKAPKYSPEETFEWDYDLLGSLGLQSRYSDYEAKRRSLSRDFDFTSRKDISDLLDFFDANRGRYSSFYAPTWEDDFVITSAISSSDTTLTVKSMHQSESEIEGEHVFLFFPDGTYTYKEITDRTNDTTLTLGSTVGKDVSLSDVGDVRCCLLFESRFDMDTLDVKYFLETAAKIKINFKTL